MRRSIEDEASCEGAKYRDRELIEAVCCQVILANLNCLATFGGGIFERFIELLTERGNRGQLAGIEGGNRVRVGRGEGRAIRSRSIRPDRSDDDQVCELRRACARAGGGGSHAG